MLALIERQNTRSVLDFVHIYQKENVMCFLRNSANKIIKFQPKDLCLKWKPKKKSESKSIKLQTCPKTVFVFKENICNFSRIMQFSSSHKNKWEIP